MQYPHKKLDPLNYKPVRLQTDCGGDVWAAVEEHRRRVDARWANGEYKHRWEHIVYPWGIDGGAEISLTLAYKYGGKNALIERELEDQGEWYERWQAGGGVKIPDLGHNISVISDFCASPGPGEPQSMLPCSHPSVVSMRKFLSTAAEDADLGLLYECMDDLGQAAKILDDCEYKFDGHYNGYARSVYSQIQDQIGRQHIIRASMKYQPDCQRIGAG